LQQQWGRSSSGSGVFGLAGCFRNVAITTTCIAAVLLLLSFSSVPQDLESRKGDYLLRRGAAHVGAWVSQFQRMKLCVPGEKLNRQGLLGLTAEGSLLLLSPFWDEAMFKRMASLQVSVACQ
jgi:hypothetical protein